MKEKRVRLGGVEVAVAVEAGRAERIRRSLPYRSLVRPALDRLQGLGSRRNGHAPPPPGAWPPAPAGAAAPPAAPADPAARAILERIAPVEWYHTIDLGHGVATPGFVDHRAQLPLYGLPADMRGLRCLDVATYDGFWAFEMERRGAEVVAIDIGSFADCDVPRPWLQRALAEGIDRPTGSGFAIARELLGSRVERRILSVYDLSPDEAGTFDVVFLSDLLLHLRDPQRALENVCSVTREGGTAVIAEPYNPDLEGFKNIALSQFLCYTAFGWWLPSTLTLRSMMELAGFGRVEEVSRFRLNATVEMPIWKVVMKGHR